MQPQEQYLTPDQVTARIQWYYDMLRTYHDSLDEQRQRELVGALFDSYAEAFEPIVYHKGVL